MRLLNIQSLGRLKHHPLFLKPQNISTKSIYSTAKYSSVAGEKVFNQSNFIETRLNLWNKLKAEHDEKLNAKVNQPIKIKLQHGSTHEGVSWQSTPYQIYDKINKKLATDAIVARVNNELWDLNRPLETDCNVELLTFDDPAAKEVFWHSSSHVLGAAIELVFGALLKSGPATDNGFFYDVFDPENKVSPWNGMCDAKFYKN